MRTTVFLSIALAIALTAPAGGASISSGAQAKLYWLSGTTVQTSRDDTTSAPVLLVTVRGVKNFRALEVQMFVNGMDSLTAAGTVPPAAWDFSVNGCNAGGMTAVPGGPSGLVFPDLITQPPALANPMFDRNEMWYAPQYCTRGHVLWFALLGDAAVPRDSTKEYAALTIHFDLSPHGDQCAGGPRDPTGPQITTIDASIFLPCLDQPNRGPNLLLYDQQFSASPVPFPWRWGHLCWRAGRNCDRIPSPVLGRTWSQLRKMYR